MSKIITVAREFGSGGRELARRLAEELGYEYYDKEILTEAIERDIVHCYCVEGMYPPNIKYMENHYGLTYDKDKFIIDYEYIGANIKPNVMIVQK